MGGMKSRAPVSLTNAFLSLLASIVVATPALAQEPVSAAPAKELAQLLTSRKIDSIAARMPDSLEEFVGALAFPGQMMVVWAKTSAPAVVNEKDRKSTRLNSSHLVISYAVFCLKKIK